MSDLKCYCKKCGAELTFDDWRLETNNKLEIDVCENCLWVKEQECDERMGEVDGEIFALETKIEGQNGVLDELAEVVKKLVNAPLVSMAETRRLSGLAKEALENYEKGTE